jgi:predicted MFS family arabinose efflux permease
MQQVLGFSPIAAGIRFLPMSLLAFVAAPIGGKLSERVPVRFLMGGGLALCAISMALMAGLTPSSEWTALLAGFVVGGVGIGLTNPALASTAIATVPREQAGAASGVNSTFRQVGIATGIAALGAIFQHQIASTLGGSGGADAGAGEGGVHLGAQRHPVGGDRDRRDRSGARPRARPAARPRPERAAGGYALTRRARKAIVR